MQIITREISRGVTMRLADTDRFKCGQLIMNFFIPLREETASLAALLPAVLMSGCNGYPTKRDISIRCDELYAASIDGGTRNYGEVQAVKFSTRFLDSSCVGDGSEDIFGGAARLLGEIIFDPLVSDGAFNADYTATERSNLIDAIRAKINNKMYYALRRGIEELCRGEAYAVPETGSEEQASRITPQKLYSFWQYLLKNASVEVMYIGRVGKGVEERLLSLISSLPASDSRKLPPTAVIRKAREWREVTEEQPVSQGKLTLGFRSASVLSDGDYYKFVMFCEVFGSSPTSKLFMNVREKKSLCYYCAARPEPHKGLLMVYSGIENSDREKAKAAILEQLEQTRDGNITPDELEAARRSVVSAYRAIYDNPGAVENWYTGRLLAGITTSPEETARQVMVVTAEDIAFCAQKVSFECEYFLLGTGGGNGDDEE